MADSKDTFIKRVVSATLAAAFLVASDYYFGPEGILLICTLVIVLGLREYARMAFAHWEMPTPLSYVYWILGLGALLTLYLWPDQALLWFGIANVAFITVTLWLTRGRVTNENLLASVALGAFGLIYCVLFPLYGIRLVMLERGEQWFLFLLFVVFFGDTFAYFGGRWFGKRKFMPMISPNKTWEGALAGLLGSTLAGSAHVLIRFPDVALWKTVVFCLACATAAQSGDLMVSLVKRVAHVKDSGTIMPGHGGILDRLDGVFIACPLVYAFALYVMN